MVIDGTVAPTYARNINSTAKIKVHEGGTSSGKTVGNLEYWLHESFKPQSRGQLFSVCRETTPNLQRGPIEDWTGIVLPKWGAENAFVKNEVKKTWTNKRTACRIEFFALDKEEKGRGPRRDRVYLNEAQEIQYKIARQLIRRTREEVLIDYNPSLIHWWIDDHILNRDDCDFFHSTYKENPYLSEDEIREIETDVPTYREADGTLVKDWDLTYTGAGMLVSGDPYEWSVYGLGKRGAPSEAIYPIVHKGDFPTGEYVRGLDFGFEHPTVLLDVARVDAERPRMHFRQQIFQKGLTNRALVELMDEMGLDKRVTIYADSSRPEAIKEIRDAGYDIVATKKGPDSVVSGIDYLRGHDLVFAPGSEQSERQFLNYRRRVVAGIVQDEPVKADDDAPDAGRYGAFEHFGRHHSTFGLWGA